MQPVPFRARHLLKMAAQPHQAAALARLTEADLRGLESPLAATLLDALGDPLVCCGAVEHWQDRAYVWAFLSDKITPRKTPTSRRVRWLLLNIDDLFTFTRRLRS